ncbi:MAG: NAD(P)/FAD-dependent oxidoreductase, partial [Actinomycetota bacterium]|nr:NAD(P)/FAD-dependent oxidoreductase [Actinomycetota bacterium]
MDAVVIGSGPNGLVAANLLADEGWSVTVLESQPQPGGAARTLELIEPGFFNDICSAFYPFGVASPIFSSLALERYGLKWRHAPLVLAHPSEDGTCPVLSRDLDETATSLAANGEVGDGDAWRRLFGRWQKTRSGLLALMFSPMPPVKGAVQLLAALGPRKLPRFLRFMILPVRRLGEEEFGADAGRRLLTGTALHADLAPETPMSGFYGWIMCALGQEVGFPVPEGGAGGITKALINRLTERGGQVHCGERVVEVVVRDGLACGVRVEGGDEIAARRAILADVSAPALYRDLLSPDHLPPALIEDLDRFQWDNATVKVDWNLEGPIPWNAEPAR